MQITGRRAVFRTSQLEEAGGEGRNPTGNPTMGEIIAARFSRRGLLEGSMAATAIAATVGAARAARRRRAPGPQGAAGLALRLPRGRRPASTPTTTSPRATTPTCCCAGATRSSPIRPSSTR